MRNAHPLYKHTDAEAYQLCLKRAREYRRSQRIVAWVLFLLCGGATLALVSLLGQFVPGGL